MRKCKLGEIAKFKTGPFGTQFKAAEYTQSGYPVINVKNIGIGRIIDNDIEFVSEKTRNRLSEHIIHEGDIVFARKGSVERHTYVRKEHDGWVQGSDCIKAKIDAGIEPRYVSYYLCLESVKKQLMLKAVGSTMPSMNTDILKDIAITLPDDEGVEKRIADFFDNINEKILSNEKIIATLESMAKTLYDYWFVQFDFPDANGRPYKTSGGKMEWNETLSREIPAGWEVQNVGSLIKKQKSIKSIERKNYSANGKYPIVDQSAEYIAGYTNDEVNALEGEDSIIVFGDHTRILKYVDFPFAIGADGTQRIVSNNKERMPQILFYYSLSRIDLSNYGYARHYKFLKDSVIVVPQKDVASNFEIQVKCWHQIISKVIRENRYLAEMRDFLMPMLMNGQVKILNGREAF